jgi:hypothetical protein
VAFVAVTVGVAAGEERWRSAAEVTPREVVPGIPIEITVRLTNAGDEPQPTPAELMIVVNPAGHATFVGRCGVGLHRRIDQSLPPTVAPGQTVVLSLSTDGSLLRPDCLDDPRLHAPGTYQLSIRLGDYFHIIADSQTLEPLDAAARYARAAAETRLVVLAPTGEDAAVWALMNPKGLEPWTSAFAWEERGQRVGERVLREFPRSAYAGWFAATGMGVDQIEKAEALRRWLDAAPRQQHSDARWNMLAEWELGVAGTYGPERPDDRDRHARLALRAAQRVGEPELRRDALEKIRSISPRVAAEAVDPRL